MKRFHVHVGVADLAASIRFYSGLFGMPPSVAKPDYAKWMIDDPRVNFAISQRGTRTGVDHLGLQADSADELADIRGHFAQANAASVSDENDVSCCYARSNKHWVRDPQGIAWEGFHSLDTVPFFGDTASPDAPMAGACCTPVAATARDEPRATCCAPAGATTADAAPAPTRCCS